MSKINMYSNWRSNNINKSSINNNYNSKMSSNRSFIGIIIGTPTSNINISSCCCICIRIMISTSNINNIINSFDKVAARYQLFYPENPADLAVEVTSTLPIKYQNKHIPGG